MNERKLSELQKEYRAFFLEKMKLYGVKSPAELAREKKSEFFTEIKQDWAKHKFLIKQKKDSEKKKSQTIVKEPIEVYKKQSGKETKKQTNQRKDWKEQRIKVQYDRQSKQQPDIKLPHKKQEQPQHKYSKEIIKSEPNQEQTNDLRILFNPNNHFCQDKDYFYPVVKMPKKNCLVKLPREGRTNQKGFKEDDFYSQIKIQIPHIETTNNVHMVIPNFNKPYEPDIVLYDKNLNLYIDIEIDEPYDGYFRYPTHYVHPEEEVKKDNIRDLFFTESGWIVIRFTEKQVHCQTNECIDHIKNILNSIYNKQLIVNFG